MSRAYQIRVKESATRELKGEDAVCTRLELLDILPPEETAELLRAELKSRGFHETADGILSRKDGSLTVTVDSCTGEVSVKSVAAETVNIEAVRVGVGFDDVGALPGKLEEKTRQQAKEDVEKKAAREAAKLQAKATADLERHLDELQPEIGKIVNKVTREALKAKAARLGSVKEIAEDEETGAMTIKLEV
jgi:FtsH ternary system domain X5